MLEYINVDQHLHLLCQIQARVAANLIPGKEDYSHTNLAFDPIGKRARDVAGYHLNPVRGQRG